MFHQSSKKVLLGVFVALLITMPVYAVKNFKVSNYGGAHQIWFEVEDFDERNPTTDDFVRIVDAADAFGKAINRGGGSGMIRWTFDISKAGGKGGTWYFWARVINPGNTSDYMLVKGDPGDTQIPTTPPFPGGDGVAPFDNADDRIFEQTDGPPWTWTPSNHEEGHTKVLQDGENTMYIFDRQGDSTVFWDVFMWTDNTNYRPTDDDYKNAVIPLPGAATNPSPVNEAKDVPRDVVLSWTPGEFAPSTNGHKVYLSENLNDVTGGIGGVTESASSHAPGLLDFDKTYYWRVDEVNGPPDYTVYPGKVWSFTTEPFAYPIQNVTATASSSAADKGPENTVNGSGLDSSGLLHDTVGDKHMWLSGIAGPQPAWIEFQFNNVYKLYEMWVWNSNESLESVLGFGFKDVTIEYSANGIDYTTLGTTHQFARAPGTPGYAHNTTIDFGGAVARYVRLTANNNWGGILQQYGLSEVRFFYIPVWAREPKPPSGATNVDADVTFGWRAGREAAQHDVYLSTDQQAVIDSNTPVITVTNASYGPVSLDLGQTYYWKVNEVNLAETPTTLDGNVWSFTTRQFLVIDDFESYNDLETTDPASNRIFNAWIDGYGTTTNGSIVGYENPPFAEQRILNTGKQAMPFFYDNSKTARYSEAELTLSPAQDWTKHGITALSLSFCGDPNNAIEQMYLKLNGSKVVYGGDAGDIKQKWYHQWNIDLASFGVNLKNVTKLGIGFGNPTSPTPGGSGVVYFDDIRLYRVLPVPPAGIWIEAEAADSITAPMKIYEHPAASGGKCIGTTDDVGDSGGNPPAPAGTATYTFTVEGGTYKVSCRIIIPAGDSFWVRIPGATTQTINHSSGWVRWSDPPNSNNWYWHDVFSAEDNGETVLFTLPAGKHTLLVAYREDCALMDAIVISKVN